jgi:3-hydroxyacyl-[acyl-carrier-protein] dehydratase
MRYLLVDRIVEVVPGTRIVGWKNVAMSEDFLEWHFPEQPIVPGMLVLEAFAQLAGWLEAVSSGFERWVHMDRVLSARCYGFSVPGDRLELTVQAVATTDPTRRTLEGEARVEGERRASAQLEAVVAPLETIDARERVERAYRALLGAPRPGGRDAARRGRG